MLYPKVSIIIPIYNAGKYLEQCIDSIYAQIYPSFEVIASYDINSTDDTLCILQTLSAKYPLIIDLGSKETSGSAGKVRNRGFLRATGEFVVFVDADDVVLPEYLSSMMDVFREYPELNAVYCNFLRVTDNTIDLVKDKNQQSGDIYTYIISRDEVLPLYFRFIKNTNHHFIPPPMAWIWLIRRQFLLDNQIFFPEFYYGEDTVFTVNIIVCSDKLGVCNKKLYLYRNTPGSITNLIPKSLVWDRYRLRDNTILKLIQEYAPKYVTSLTIVYNRGVVCHFSQFDYKKYSHELDKQNITYLNPQISSSISEYGMMCLFNISRRACYLALKIYYGLFYLSRQS